MRFFVRGDFLGVFFDQAAGLEWYLRPAGHTALASFAVRESLTQAPACDGPQVELRFEVLQVEGEV
ncbi:hypothetical protein BJQ89_02863 [Arthrobacter sp. ES1]|nr:hypothetical protein [Arthrobacter sp. ES1]